MKTHTTLHATRKLLLAGFTTFIVSLSLAPNAVSQILGTELVTNGDFETGNTTGWGVWHATISAITPGEGGVGYAMKVVNDGGDNIDGAGLQNGIAMDSGKKYKLQFDFLTDDTTDIYVRLYVADGDGSGEYFADFTGLSATWKHYSYDYTVPGTTSTSVQVAFFPVKANGGIAYIDNVSIREVIPEPSSVALMVGAIGLLSMRSLRRRNMRR